MSVKVLLSTIKIYYKIYILHKRESCFKVLDSTRCNMSCVDVCKKSIIRFSNRLSPNDEKTDLTSSYRHPEISRAFSFFNLLTNGITDFSVIVLISLKETFSSELNKLGSHVSSIIRVSFMF